MLAWSHGIDHDRLFKELLKTFLLEFLELFFPEVASNIDPQRLEFLDKEIFTDVTRGERHEVDLIVKAAFRGQSTHFLIHAEAQSRRQGHFPERMFSYFARLHEEYGVPVYPIAVFSYASPLKAEPNLYEVGFPDLDVLKFRYRTVQLNRLNWRRFVGSTNPVASALMARMRIAKRDRPRVKLECLRLLAACRLDKAKQQLISGFVDTYLRLEPQELIVYKKEIAKLDPQEVREVFKLTTSWKEEGRIEGTRDGLLLGLEPALRLRFGDQGVAFLDLLKDNVELEKLVRIADQVVTAPNLDTLHGIAFGQ